MRMLDSPTPDNDCDWPYDQSYACICRKCREEAMPTTPLPMDEVPSRHAPEFQFAGPKRAPSCWKHTHEDTRTWWLAKFNVGHPH